MLAVCHSINIEDLEDVGIHRLGHQKKLMLAIKKINTIIRRKSRTRSETFKPRTEPFSTFHNGLVEGYGKSLPRRPKPSGHVRLGTSSLMSQSVDSQRWCQSMQLPTPSPPPYPALDELEQTLLKVRTVNQKQMLEVEKELSKSRPVAGVGDVQQCYEDNQDPRDHPDLGSQQEKESQVQSDLVPR